MSGCRPRGGWGGGGGLSNRATAGDAATYTTGAADEVNPQSVGVALFPGEHERHGAGSPRLYGASKCQARASSPLFHPSLHTDVRRERPILQQQLYRAVVPSVARLIAPLLHTTLTAGCLRQGAERKPVPRPVWTFKIILSAKEVHSCGR